MGFEGLRHTTGFEVNACLHSKMCRTWPCTARTAFCACLGDRDLVFKSVGTVESLKGAQLNVASASKQDLAEQRRVILTGVCGSPVRKLAWRDGTNKGKADEGHMNQNITLSTGQRVSRLRNFCVLPKQTCPSFLSLAKGTPNDESYKRIFLGS
jgi:hypothetical protein